MTEGFWKYGDDGRPMYSEENGACGPGASEPWDRQHTYREEFIGQIIDMFEDFLDRNVRYFGSIDWAEMERDPSAVILRGDYFDELAESADNLLRQWEINV